MCNGQPLPTGYVCTSEARWGPLATGIAIFGIFYGVSFGIATMDPDIKAFYVPVAGPFLIARRELAAGSSSDLIEVLLLDGIAQATGAALMVIGLVARREVPERASTTIHAMPILNGNQAGAQVLGSF